MACSRSIPPSSHPFRSCWTIMVASSHVWVHTLHWAMLFNYLCWSRRKYIAHISEAKCLGQTHREIKYTLCHLIWQLSFPQLLDRGRHICGYGNVAVYRVCGVNADVLFMLGFQALEFFTQFHVIAGFFFKPQCVNKENIQCIPFLFYLTFISSGKQFKKKFLFTNAAWNFL